MIDSSTSLYGLIGQPVAGSRSPWIHNRVFDTFAIAAAYLTFDVEEERLQDAVNGFRALKAKGFNITIPYKSAILPMLDRVEGAALRLGAVNTVINKDGRLIGYNTDGDGLLRVLERHLGNLSAHRVLVLGAGGAAKGICGSLVAGGAVEIGIWNRTFERAQQLQAVLAEQDCGTCRIEALQDTAGFSRYTLIINTTSVGMEPNIRQSPISLDGIAPHAAVCDIVYKPHHTQLLKDASDRGHAVIYGIEMLIEQALLAQQLWNGLSEEELAPVRNTLIREFEALNK